MTLIVNLFGGPGIGKSAVAYGIMHELKWDKVSCEYVDEYAKGVTWEERHVTLGCQPYITGKQFRNIERLIGKVDVIVTDSPLLIGVCYANDKLPQSFFDFTIEQFKQYNNFNVLLERECDYDSRGRNQTEDESHSIDAVQRHLLNRHDICYMIAPGRKETAAVLSRIIKRNLETGPLEY